MRLDTEWVYAHEVAEYFGVSRNTVRTWIQRGDLPAEQVPNRHYTDDRPRRSARAWWRVRVADLDAFIARMRSA